MSVAGENAGIIFNTANGSDTIVGFKGYKNRFEIYNGNKIFVGGEKNDTFVLNFDAHYPNETRYLDGYAGSNSIIINQLPVIKSNSNVDIEKNSTNLQGFDKDSFTIQDGVLVNLAQEEIWAIQDNQYAVDNYDNGKSFAFMQSQRLATIKNMENVTVVANSADIIVGDARDNVLDGNLGDDKLYGGKGNDTLILTQGIADGGEGHDVYRIKRYNWQDHIEIFADDNLQYQHWDPIKGAFVFVDTSSSEEIASSSNPKFRFNNGYSYNAQIVIDDSHRNIDQQSVVYLDYDINEIKSVSRSGNDIVIEVEIINNAKFIKNNIISHIAIRLKNVYAQDEKGNYFTNHEYNVKCQNSFLLSPILVSKADKNKNPTEYFKAAYVRPKYPNEGNVYTNDVEVNFARNSFKVFSKDIYKMPTGIKVMAKILTSNGMTIIGDNDDQIIALAAQYYIYVSKGNDFYLIKSMTLKNLPDVDTTFNLNEDIIFDFSKVKNSLDSKDKIIIVIQEYSGYDFEFDGDRLIHKDKVGKIANIVFKNLPNNEIKNIIVQDKNQQHFVMSLKKGENKIFPMNAIKEPTSGHDIIELPVGYRLNANRLDAMAGDDIITDLSGRDNIINAGSGDDMVTVIKGNNIIDAGTGDDIVVTAKGHNIILPGEGNDIVNSGIGDDIIITTNGNDEINSGKGNNAIFINHQVGHITINHAGGTDTIYIQSFEHYFSDGNIRYYIADNQQDCLIKSKDNKSSITIKNAVANDDKIKIYKGINNGKYLDSDSINILIDKLSAFNKEKDRASLNLIDFINTGVEKNIFVASQYSY